MDSRCTYTGIGLSLDDLYFYKGKKYKAIHIQARIVSWGFQISRQLANEGSKVVTALGTGRLYPPGNIRGILFY